MAITTVGGSGATSASTATGSGSNVFLFTTPSTADVMYTVSVVVSGGCGISTADTNAVAGAAASTKDSVSQGVNLGTIGGPWAHPGHGGHPGKPGRAGSKAHSKSFKMIVGPSTNVYVPVFNTDVSTRTIYISWNYCGIAFV